MDANKRQRWLTNLDRLETCEFNGCISVEVEAIVPRGDWLSTIQMYLKSLTCNAIILYQPPDFLIWALCMLRLFTLWYKPKLVLLDIVFVRPGSGLRARIKQKVKCILLSQVDLFVSFMNHVPELKAVYGIHPDRHFYVPFKPNSFARAHLNYEFPDGEYVFTGGRSRRDFLTFCKAMEILGYPAVIVTPLPEDAKYHGTSFDARSCWASPLKMHLAR